MQVVVVRAGEIKLDSFLKWAGVTVTGGQAKDLVLAGAVRVNGAVECRRGRKLHDGDTVDVAGRTFEVRGPDHERHTSGPA